MEKRCIYNLQSSETQICLSPMALYKQLNTDKRVKDIGLRKSQRSIQSDHASFHLSCVTDGGTIPLESL